MNRKSFSLLVLTLALVFIIGGCRAAEEAPPAPADVATPATPVEVTESFYNWYLNYGGDSSSGEMKNPLVDGVYRASPYLTADYVAKVDAILASFDQGGYDPILQAQDIPQRFSVEEDYTAENDACVIVHEVWEGSPAHDLTVDLVKHEGVWKINNIRAGNPRTPDGVTRLFYDWYVDYAKNQGNPLVDEVYKSSPYLSPAFIASVEEIRAGFEGGGYDPILLAQDVPVGLSVEAPLIEGDSATVVVQQYWGGNPQPRPITVHLQAVDGRWQIDAVTAEELAAEPLAPDEVVQAFYDWYLAYIGDPGSEDFRNPLVDKVYRQSEYLTADFVVNVDELLAGFEGGGYDPFLCAQDVPKEIITGVTFMNGETPGVIVTSSFPNQVITVDLSQVGPQWQISNIICNMTAEGTAKAFYTWYLGYIGDRASGEFRNPLVDGAYRDTIFLSENLVQRVDETVASFDQGGFDPFLLAQDIPQSFSVDPGPAENKVVVHLQFGPDSVRLLSLTFTDTYPPRIDVIEEATPPVDEATTTTGTSVATVDMSGWQTFSDEEHGYAFQYPADWVIEAIDLGGPGMPDDWPVVRAFHLMPPDVAEQLAAHSGAPDPNAPVIIAPLLVEVTVGDEAAFNRVYVVPLSSETAIFNGYTATVQRQDPGYSQYVFRHPADSNVWIVVTDWVTGFPGREAQAEAVAGVLEPLLKSFTFSQ